MSWFRVDDTLHAHRKLAKAGAEAMGLWVACGSFAASAASRQDGSLDADEVAMRATLLGVRDWKRLADRLVSVGLWDVDGDLYRFHDWDHFASADGASEARRLKAAERQAKSRAKRQMSQPVTRDSHTMSHVTERDMSQPVTCDSHTPSHVVTTPPRAIVHDRAGAHPVPTRPDPSRPAAAADAGDPAGSGGEVLDMGALRRLWNQARERATGAMFPATFSADDNAALAALPRVHVAADSGATFVDWLGVEVVAWVREVTASHGSGGVRLTSCWAPKSFSGWYQRKGSHLAPKARHGAPGREEPHNPFGPPTDEELRAHGVIQ